MLLTVLTQVGGVIYLGIILIAYKLNLSRIRTIGMFTIAYLVSTFIVIPLIAPVFGRTNLPMTGNLRPLNIGTCFLNRHYVRPEFKKQLVKIADQMNSKSEGTKINYLDANFPFYNGFALLPHLSHNDGKKVDLAFYYNDISTGERTNDSPSFIGYGVHDSPTNNEVNYPDKCSDKGYWQYGALKQVVPQWNKDDFAVDVERTKELIRLLSVDDLTSKIFIEPHLKQRWGLSQYNNIRYHGCQAVRHDDHIHSQIR
jgi:hypothetical protein